MSGDIWHVVLELWAGVAEGVMSGGTTAKFVSFLIPAIPASYGIYVKWRNSGYRLVDRREEFIGDQEKRLVDARAKLADLVEVPSPNRSIEKPAISSHSLGRALRKMHWGYGTAAANDLDNASRISSQQAKLAMRRSREHEQRQALAHLLLGARSASKQIKDLNERNAARAEALAHFEKALEIDANDADAVEYAGMMLLELANPAGALDRFNQLITLRENASGAPLARAYRLQATAYESLPLPLYRNASTALGRALQLMPASAALDRALTHEHQAQLRIRLRNFGVANTSLQNALTIYQTIRTSREGKMGLERVMNALADLNRMQAGESQAESSASGAQMEAGSEPQPSWVALLTKTAKLRD